MFLSHPSRGIKDEEDGTRLDEEQTAENLSDGSPDVLLLPVVQHLVNERFSLFDDSRLRKEGDLGRRRGREDSSFRANEASLKIERERETGGEGRDIDSERDLLARFLGEFANKEREEKAPERKRQRERGERERECERDREKERESGVCCVRGDRGVDLTPD